MDKDLKDSLETLAPKLDELGDAVGRIKTLAEEIITEKNEDAAALAAKVAKDAEDLKEGKEGKKKDAEDKKEGKEEASKAEEIAKAALAEADRLKAEADEKERLATEDSAKAALAEAEKAKADDLKKVIASIVSNPISEDTAKEFGLDETEVALASKYSLVDLVKLTATLTKEVAEVKKAKDMYEKKDKAAARLTELSESGLVFVGEKATAQKVEIEGMSDEQFTTYKTTLSSIKESLGSGEGFDKNEREKAMANVAKASIAVDNTKLDLRTKMSQL